MLVRYCFCAILWLWDLVFVRSCSYNYILRASTVWRLNTEDWATSANLSTRNSDQAKNLRTKLETRTTTFIHPDVDYDGEFQGTIQLSPPKNYTGHGTIGELLDHFLHQKPWKMLIQRKWHRVLLFMCHALNITTEILSFKYICLVSVMIFC